MTNTQRQTDHPSMAKRAVVAGLAGGLVEMLWVGLYASGSAASSYVVASEISRTVLPAVTNPLLQPVLGVGIHISLSIALALGFAWMIAKLFSSRQHGAALLAEAAIVLLAVWAINFFILLPVLNPYFVTLLPYSVTLASKLMFAVAMTIGFSYPVVEIAASRLSASG